MPLSYLQKSARDCRGTSGAAALAVPMHEATASTLATFAISNTSVGRQHKAIVGATGTIKAGKSTVATHPAAAADADTTILAV